MRFLMLPFLLLLGLSACKNTSSNSSAPAVDEYERYLERKAANWKGKTLPNWTLPLLEGGEVNLHALRGKPVLLSFWFVDCAPCIVEIPSLNELQKDFGDKGLQVIAIARDKAGAVQALAQKKDMQYQVVADGQRWIDELEVKVFPSNFLLDSQGRIVQVEQGGSSFDATLTYRQFKPEILRLLGEQP